MIYQDLHMHTSFDDGADTPETMVHAAAAAGMRSVGVSVHSPIEGENWCASKQQIPEFIAELKRLKAVYSGKMDVYCGMEYDLCSMQEFDGFDYVIGSAHMLSLGGKTFSVDNTRSEAKALIKAAGGQAKAAQTYYDAVTRCAAIPEVSIVGHFDLLTKFNEPSALYDTTADDYIDASHAAMELLVKNGKIFEINIGAISRKFRTSAYPSAELLRALRSMNGRILLSSDAHDSRHISFGFEKAAALAVNCGFTEIWQLCPTGFEAVRL